MPKLFHNLGHHRFKEMAAEAGVDDLRDGRGIALLDFDNDGAMDLFVTNCNQEAVLYHNESRKKNRNNFLELKLVGVKSNRNAIGARVRVVSGPLQQIREVNGGNGYASQSTFRLHFGLGRAEKIDRVEIKWPSGIVQTLTEVPINRILTVSEDAGQAAASQATKGPVVR